MNFGTKLASLMLLIMFVLILLIVFTTPHAHAAECGVASWYDYSGHRTANGEHFPLREQTAAHRSLPFNTLVLVRDVKTGRTVRVRVNDRGPYVRGRVIDLSPSAMRALGMHGLAQVCLSVLSHSGLSGAGTRPARAATHAGQHRGRRTLRPLVTVPAAPAPASLTRPP